MVVSLPGSDVNPSVDIVSKIGTNPCNIDNGHNISGINIDASGNVNIVNSNGTVTNISGSNIVNIASNTDNSVSDTATQ